MPMHMRRGSRLLSVAAATAAVASLATSPAFAAATTWTVSPGGAVTGTATTTDLSDSTTGTTLTCTSSSANATLKSGSGLTSPLGTITAISFNNCTGPLGISFSASVTGPFPMKANSYNASSGTTAVKITHIHGSLSGPLCSAVVDGTSATANNGTVKATYNNSTGLLQVLATGGSLHIYNVSGCFGLINSGDTATFTATYGISPGQTITSP